MHRVVSECACYKIRTYMSRVMSRDRAMRAVMVKPHDGLLTRHSKVYGIPYTMLSRSWHIPLLLQSLSYCRSLGGPRCWVPKTAIHPLAQARPDKYCRSLLG